MQHVAVKVLSRVNASYRVQVSAEELAAKIVDPESARLSDASVFAFFSEVDPRLQLEFIEAMGVDEVKARHVAALFASRSGFELPLAE
jgi:hypothetical protein